MAAFEVIALDTATPQLRAPGASDTYTFPRAVEMPLGTANGVLFLNGSKVVTSGSGLTFDSSGNLGLGVTPSAWNTSFKALEYSAGYVAAISTSELDIGQNNFYSASLGTWAYKNTAGATQYRQTGSEHRWFTAPSGTAGNAISFTQAMTLDASGNLGIGLSSPLVKLHIADPTSATVRVTSIGNANFDMTCSATQAIIGSPNGIPLLFNTSNTERLRLKSTGQLRYVPLSSDPAGAENGDVYYNSTTNKLRLYAAGAWVDLN